MATDLATIRTAIETLIAGLTPVGTSHGKSSYSVAGAPWDWSQRSAGDIDREFTVGEIPPGRCLWIGSYSDCPLETEVEVIVGHAMTADVSAGLARKQRDLEQIARKVSWPGASSSWYAPGVLTMNFKSLSTSTVPGEPDGAWVSRLKFTMQFLGTAEGE